MFRAEYARTVKRLARTAGELVAFLTRRITAPQNPKIEITVWI
jgi:hypothetical protein